MVEKIQPQDLDSEQSVLGAMMMSKDAIALAIGKLKPRHFYRSQHSVIYESILNLYKKNEPVDLVTVSDELKKMDRLDEVGGRSYLAEIIDVVPSASNVMKYADIVFEKALLRRLIDAGSDMISQAFSDTQEPKEVIEAAQKTILDLSREGIEDGFVHLKEPLNKVFDTIQNSYGDQDGVMGVPTGFSDLDTMTSGFQPGDLVILAARPSQGKTTLALNFAASAAIEKNIPVAIFSCEMPKEQLALRLLCSEARVDSARLRTSHLQEHEYASLMQAMGRLSEAPIYIDDTPGISPLELRAKTRRLQTKADIKLILIDYLQLMRLGKNRIESRYHEVSEIVREVKGFAKESQIPIIALSQISRDVEKRQDKLPMLSDLRESGEIEQTADLVMFIHRDDTYETGQPSLLNIKLIIAKQRNGPTGHVNLVFKKDISKFMMAAPLQQVPE